MADRVPTSTRTHPTLPIVDDRPDPRIDASLQASVKDIRAFADTLATIAEKLPPSTTTSQLAFFLYASVIDVTTNSGTFSAIKESFAASLGRSLHTTYRVFLDGAKRRGTPERDGLEWLTDVVNPDNRREKFLRLTPLGKKIVSELASQIAAVKVRTK